MIYTIKDVENLSGIKAHTIRIWEQRYSFLKPKRSGTNIRYYTSDELKTLLSISVLNKHGYKISHIDKMHRDEIFQNVLSLSDKEAKVSVTVNQLLETMIDLDIEHFEKIVNTSIKTSGLEKTLLQVIFSFLDKVGILWQSNQINAAQERLVSNIIRQKIIVAIDNLKPKTTGNAKFCLFLPEGEYHEISLLFVDFLFKQKGLKTIYLGASIPLAELKTIIDIKKPDYLYTHLTTAGEDFNFEHFIKLLHNSFPEIKTIISGRIACSYDKAIPKNISFKKSIQELKEFISSL
jgi:DNA-binding transcriptional MerR regulator